MSFQRRIIATISILPLLRFLPRLPGNRKFLCKVEVAIQQAEDFQPKPLRILKIADVSTSMDRSVNASDPWDSTVPKKLAALKEALYAFILRLRPQDQLALLRFSDACNLADDLLLGFTEGNAHGRNLMLGAIDRLTPRGNTDFSHPLRAALELFRGLSNFDDYTNVVIFDTDGQDLGNKPQAVALCEELRQMGVLLYGCGFGVVNAGEQHLSQMFGGQYAQLNSEADALDFHRMVVEDVQDALLTNAQLVFAPVEYDAYDQAMQLRKQSATIERLERVFKNADTLYEEADFGQLELGSLGLNDTYTVYAQLDFPVPAYAATAQKGALGMLHLIADVPGARSQTIVTEAIVARFADNHEIATQTADDRVRQLKDDATIARGGTLIGQATSTTAVQQQLLIIAATAPHASHHMQRNVAALIERSRQAAVSNATVEDFGKLAREAATGAFAPEIRRKNIAAAIKGLR